MKTQTLLLLVGLVLAGCQGRPVGRPFPDINLQDRSIVVEGSNVHLLAPCATLTPHTDYRDFMALGETIIYSSTVLVGHVTPLPTPPANMQYLPPAEATLVFDNSEGCN